jgi:hypothetical protein
MLIGRRGPYPGACSWVSSLQNIPVSVQFLEEDEITYVITDSKIVINLNLTDKILYTNWVHNN